MNNPSKKLLFIIFLLLRFSTGFSSLEFDNICYF
nr:MAG TPA: hypothetical protein [Caudoviricetes sp.]DAU57326.1 MAG TPA: hypothetical protein [Caudoviricetes sp.]